MSSAWFFLPDEDDDVRGPDQTGKNRDRCCLIQCAGNGGKCGKITAVVTRLSQRSTAGESQYIIRAAERVKGGFRVDHQGRVGPIPHGFPDQVEVPRCRAHQDGNRNLVLVAWPDIRRVLARGVKRGRLPRFQLPSP